jgi:TonB family protein
MDILDQRDPIGVPFIGSIFFHLFVAGTFFVGWFWMNRAHENLGDINPGGGPSYSVSPVHNIPIPRRQAPPNPVANDTESMVRTAPAKQDAEKKQPDKAIEIPDKQKPKKQAERPQREQKYLQPAPQNQVYARTRQAVSSPLYGQSGSGQVGIGPNSPLGSRLGWYAELIRERIAQNWHTNGLDASSQRAAAIISFTILRDGTVRNPQVVQSSGNPNIDNTALRAVYEANPMPALPPQITDSYISAQFTFNLR